MARCTLRRGVLALLAAAALLLLIAGPLQAREGADEDDPFEGLDFLEDEFEDQSPRIADPLRPFNLAMFHFNDKLYLWVLKPVAKGYKKVTPQPVRRGIKNFFRNLFTPIRLVNCLLQGKGESAGTEVAKFMVNTTAGVLGFGNPAEKRFGLVCDEEDFGQTLAVYGLGDGIYVVWPFLGPSTLRDTVGMAGDRFVNPVTYVQPAEAGYGASGLMLINDTSFRIGDYESLKDNSPEPYEAFKSVYLQYRRKKISE
jgi:phospholipid-binding lipoprotein MlaA